jgi:putative hydroxymethylpyrimidine transport system permease protein
MTPPKPIRLIIRPLITLFGLVVVWALVGRGAHIPTYLLPGPHSVANALWSQRDVLIACAGTTLAETLLGLLVGVLLGVGCALIMVFSPVVERWLMPLVLLSQAVPVFALAPLLVLWFGFGMASKVVMAVLIIFFPITAAFSDGLRRTETGWLDLARTMNASPWAILSQVRLPAALPAFGSGLRVATAIAPIGAVVGEWVGASSGLGYIMLNANARLQTDEMFAALLVLALMTIALWTLVDQALKRLLYWAPDTTAAA